MSKPSITSIGLPLYRPIAAHRTAALRIRQNAGVKNAGVSYLLGGR